MMYCMAMVLMFLKVLRMDGMGILNLSSSRFIDGICFPPNLCHARDTSLCLFLVLNPHLKAFSPIYTSQPIRFAPCCWTPIHNAP